jgi:hypothetical protein
MLAWHFAPVNNLLPKCFNKVWICARLKQSGRYRMALPQGVTATAQDRITGLAGRAGRGRDCFAGVVKTGRPPRIGASGDDRMQPVVAWRNFIFVCGKNVSK